MNNYKLSVTIIISLLALSQAFSSQNQTVGYYCDTAFLITSQIAICLQNNEYYQAFDLTNPSNITSILVNESLCPHMQTSLSQDYYGRTWCFEQNNNIKISLVNFFNHTAEDFISYENAFCWIDYLGHYVLCQLFDNSSNILLYDLTEQTLIYQGSIEPPGYIFYVQYFYYDPEVNNNTSSLVILSQITNSSTNETLTAIYTINNSSNQISISNQTLDFNLNSIINSYSINFLEDPGNNLIVTIVSSDSIYLFINDTVVKSYSSYYESTWQYNSTHFMVEGNDIKFYTLNSNDSIIISDQFQLPNFYNLGFNNFFLLPSQQLGVCLNGDFAMTINLTTMNLVNVYNYDSNNAIQLSLANGTSVLLSTSHIYINNQNLNSVSQDYYDYQLSGIYYYPYTTYWLLVLQETSFLQIDLTLSEFNSYPISYQCLNDFTVVDVVVSGTGIYYALICNGVLFVSAGNGTYQQPVVNADGYFFNGSQFTFVPNGVKISDTLYYIYDPANCQLNIYQMSNQSLFQQTNISYFTNISNSTFKVEFHPLNINETIDLVVGWAGIITNQSYQTIFAMDSLGNVTILMRNQSLMNTLIFGNNTLTYNTELISYQFNFNDWPTPIPYPQILPNPQNRAGSSGLTVFIVVILVILVILILGGGIYAYLKYFKKKAIKDDQKGYFLALYQN